MRVRKSNVLRPGGLVGTLLLTQGKNPSRGGEEDLSLSSQIGVVLLFGLLLFISFLGPRTSPQGTYPAHPHLHLPFISPSYPP